MTPEVKAISANLWSNDVWMQVAEYPLARYTSYLLMPYAYVRIWLVSSFEHAAPDDEYLWSADGVEDDPFFELADCLLDSEDEVIAP